MSTYNDEYLYDDEAEDIVEEEFEECEELMAPYLSYDTEMQLFEEREDAELFYDSDA